MGCADDGGADEGNDEVAATETEDGETETGTDTETGESSGTDETETETDSTESSETTETGGESDTGTTGEEPACDGSDPVPADWFIQLLEGDFPDDLPTDAEEACAILESPANVLRVDCPSFAFDLELTATPTPTLPAPVAMGEATVRVHHEPGWLNWPDLWIDVEVAGVERWAFTAASVLDPLEGSYAVPWSPALTGAECGPFIVTTPFGEDSCGEQVARALEFSVDGASVEAWHATHFETSVDARAFEGWISAAREYIEPPEFCDVSPTWYSMVTRREL